MLKYSYILGYFYFVRLRGYDIIWVLFYGGMDLRNLFFVFVFSVMPICAYADIASIDDAIETARVKCSGISAQMTRLKTLAGINTAVTGVGGAAGVGATVSGVVKNEYDKRADTIEEIMAQYKNSTTESDNHHLNDVYLDENLLRAQLASVDVENEIKLPDIQPDQMDRLEDLHDTITKKSKQLGNVRTGLMATSAATNIAGVVIAANNKINDDFKSRITQCVAAVDALRDAKMQAHLDGVDENEIARADTIINACGKYAYANLDKINNRATGATVSGAIGTATGIGGTITSAMANSDKVRDGDATREKNINTAANVLGGVTTAASLTATVFNATQIKAIKNVSEIADDCEGALK